jgi:undecaprenyl-diphosphatase
MTILTTIILGIVEGLTEFLPISSTGHLILASNILGLNQNDFLKSFEIIIQLGAILAVIVLYYKDLFVIENIKKLIVGFIPTGLIGFLIYKIVKTYFFGNQNIILWSIFLGGIILIFFEIWYKSQENKQANSIDKLIDINANKANTDEQIKSITYKKALIIGLFQSIAIIPGVSRSAATIIGGLSLGLSRELIVKFSFLLAVPTMIVASGYDILKNASAFSLDQFGTLTLGFVVSFVVAIFAIKFLLKFISKHSFIGFGVYRIVLAVVVWVWVFGM